MAFATSSKNSNAPRSLSRVLVPALLVTTLSGCALIESMTGRWSGVISLPTMIGDSLTRAERQTLREVLAVMEIQGENDVKYCVWSRPITLAETFWDEDEGDENNQPDDIDTSSIDTPATDLMLGNLAAETSARKERRRALDAFAWHYPALDDLLAARAYRPADLAPMLDDTDPNVANNAAMAMIRVGDPTQRAEYLNAIAERLTTIVAVSNHPIALRCAAAESLGSIHHPETGPRLRELIDQFGDLSMATRGAKTPRGQLTAELLHGLARHVRPDEDPRFTKALSAGEVEVRLIAIEAMLNCPDIVLPPRLADLRHDRDPNVRAAALRAMGRRRDAQTVLMLRAAARDLVPTVRLAAVKALAEIGSAEARAALVEEMSSQGEIVRAAIVRGLVRIDAESDALEAAGDRSWRVRREVARALGTMTDRRAPVVARGLLTDPSIDVQQAIVESAANWPLDRAGHLLLAAVEKSAYTTRRLAAGQLASRWPPAELLQLDAPSAQRHEQLEELRERFVREIGPDDTNDLSAMDSAEGFAPSYQYTEEQLDDLSRDLDAVAIDRLRTRGDRLDDQLAQLAARHKKPIPAFVFTHVLPEVDPVFRHLGSLQTAGNLLARRTAAGEIETLGRAGPLGPLAVDRICRWIHTESDTIVWQRLLTATWNDQSEPSVRLAMMAIGHQSAEVRIAACKKLGDHRDPALAPVLMPALADRSQAVVIEAIRALGGMPDPVNLSPLRPLLGRADEPVRLEAAIALSKRKDYDGRCALERLSYSADASTRQAVARAMGLAPHPDYVRTLIRLLDDRTSVALAALDALPAITNTDPTEQYGDRLTTAQRAAVWKEWARTP